MFKRWKDKIQQSNLSAKISYSYLLLVIPSLVLTVILLVSIVNINNHYDNMVNAAVVASDFSLDFKSDYDYEAYLLIVGNKTVEESKLNSLLWDAREIVNKLQELTETEDNQKRLDNISRYLTNLSTYQSIIEGNLGQENKYEDNIEVWENDIQIVTSLIEENMSEYIFYEIREVQNSRAEYNRLYRRVFIAIISALLFMTALTAWMSSVIPRSITRPLRELRSVLDRVSKGDLTARSEVQGDEEVDALSDSFNSMIDQINVLLEQVKEEQIHLRKAELEILQMQINPHFLYNTLDTIIWLAEGGDMKKVVALVGSLSAFFRTSLNQGREGSTVEEEERHIRSYLEIQQLRYQDILEYEIQLPKELYQYELPKITLQPLVENALYHGIKNKRGKGKITVTGERDGAFVRIHITDNGKGMTPERLEQVCGALKNKNLQESKVYGVFNVNERIQLKYGENYGVSFESEDGVGTVATITIPAETE